MEKEMKISLLLLLLSSFNIYAGDREGNGGGLDDMLRADRLDQKSLTTEQIFGLLEDNAIELKEKVIIPSFKTFLRDKEFSEDSKLFELQTVFNMDNDLLLNDLRYSKYKIGECDGSNFCTGAEKYSDIVIDLDSLQTREFGITLSEFIGLLAHEYTHHFVGDLDHPEYLFARYIRNNIRDNKYQGKIFSTLDIISHYKKKKKGILVANGNNHLFQANSFCRDKGYATSSDYKTSILSANALKKMDVVFFKLSFRTIGKAIRTYHYVQDIDDSFYKVNSYDWNENTAKTFTQIECRN